MISNRIKRWAKNKFTQLVDFSEQVRLTAPPPNVYLWRAMQNRATQETIDFICENMTEAIFFENRFKLLNYALKQRPEGMIAEFGVYLGTTINFIAHRVRQETHGFDSFDGLPTNWAGYIDLSESFKNNGCPPKVLKNVTLHIGWFKDTLPKFLDEHIGNFSVIHIDCDIYASTKVIFDNCASRIQSGTVLVFDEFFNYINWQQHEFKAFQEYIEGNDVQCEYIGYSGCQVAVKIKK